MTEGISFRSVRRLTPFSCFTSQAQSLPMSYGIQSVPLPVPSDLVMSAPPCSVEILFFSLRLRPFPGFCRDYRFEENISAPATVVCKDFNPSLPLKIVSACSLVSTSALVGCHPFGLPRAINT